MDLYSHHYNRDQNLLHNLSVFENLCVAIFLYAYIYNNNPRIAHFFFNFVFIYGGFHSIKQSHKKKFCATSKKVDILIRSYWICLTVMLKFACTLNSIPVNRTRLLKFFCLFIFIDFVFTKKYYFWHQFAMLVLEYSV